MFFAAHLGMPAHAAPETGITSLPNASSSSKTPSNHAMIRANGGVSAAYSIAVNHLDFGVPGGCHRNRSHRSESAQLATRSTAGGLAGEGESRRTQDRHRAGRDR